MMHTNTLTIYLYGDSEGCFVQQNYHTLPRRLWHDGWWWWWWWWFRAAVSMSSVWWILSSFKLCYLSDLLLSQLPIFTKDSCCLLTWEDPLEGSRSVVRDISTCSATGRWNVITWDWWVVNLFRSTPTKLFPLVSNLTQRGSCHSDKWTSLKFWHSYDVGRLSQVVPTTRTCAEVMHRTIFDYA